MACKARILPTAEQELDDIAGYLAKHSADVGKRFLDAWDRAVDNLEGMDLDYALSRFAPLAELGYRAFAVGAYVVLYRRKGGCIEIAHIFHQSRDYARLVLAREAQPTGSGPDGWL